VVEEEWKKGRGGEEGEFRRRGIGWREGGRREREEEDGRGGGGWKGRRRMEGEETE
jgi:hypothetical protein